VLLRLEPADGLRRVVVAVGALEPDFVSVDVSHHGGTPQRPWGNLKPLNKPAIPQSAKYIRTRH
jgi:hypothetical protein